MSFLCTTNKILCNRVLSKKPNIGFLGYQTSGTPNKWYCLISWIFGQVGCQASCMDLSIRHQIRHTKSGIKEFTEIVDEFKECSLEYRRFVEIYFHYIYIYTAMKKCYYKGPNFKLCRGSWGSAFIFWRESWGSLSNFEGGPGCRVPGSRGPGSQGPELTFTPCHSELVMKNVFMCILVSDYISTFVAHLPSDLKQYKSLERFKSKIKNWIPENCPCKLWKTYLQRIGYVQISN